MSAVATVIELRPEPNAVGSYDPTLAWTPTAEQYAAFQAVFEHFNIELFEGTLPPVMLAFAKHNKTLGYYAAKRWGRRGDDERTIGEIALNPDHVGDDERDVASTIAHEMVHHWQFTSGKPSRRGYHNAEWASKMEAVGLVPSTTGEPGGKKTGQRVSHYIVEGGPFAIAYEKLARDVLLPFIAGSSAQDKPKPEPKKDDSKSKFTCPTCGDCARGKPTLEIGCRKCGVPMVREGAASVETAPMDGAGHPAGAPASEAKEPEATQADGKHEAADDDFDWKSLDAVFEGTAQGAP